MIEKSTMLTLDLDFWSPQGSADQANTGNRTYDAAMCKTCEKSVREICNALMYLKNEPEKVCSGYEFIAQLGAGIAALGINADGVAMKKLLEDTLQTALENNPGLDLPRLEETLLAARSRPLPVSSIYDIIMATKAILRILLQDAKNQEILAPGKAVSVDETVAAAAESLFALHDIVRLGDRLLYRPRWSSDPFQLLPAGNDRKEMAEFRTFSQRHLKFKNSDTGESKTWVANLEGPLSRHMQDHAPVVRYIGPPAWVDGQLHLASDSQVVITELKIARVQCTPQESRSWLQVEIFNDYYFHTDQDRNKAFLSLFRPLLNPGIRGHKPLTLWNAPQMGVGKTTLAALGASIMSDMPKEILAVKPNIKDEAMFGKFLASAIRTGRTYFVFDNLKFKLDSPQLEAMTTTSN